MKVPENLSAVKKQHRVESARFFWTCEADLKRMLETIIIGNEIISRKGETLYKNLESANQPKKGDGYDLSGL